MKILYLFPRKLYHAKMSRGRVLYGEAVARQPGVELRVSGEGWPDWRDADTVSANLERWGWAPDLIWSYKAESLRGLDRYPCRKLVCFNEAWAPKTLEEIRAADADVIVFHHAGDIPQWRFLEAEGVKLVHLLHCADHETFAPSGMPLASRTTACLLSGVQSPEIYPLRARFAKLLRSGAIPGVIRPHPGYRLETEAANVQQYRDYAGQLRTARISLCCSSRHRYPLAKYVEAMAAGCAVVGDMPDDPEFRETLGRHILQVDPSWPDARIAAFINDWLARPDELAVIAAAGQAMAIREFTTDRYAERLLDAIR